MKIGRTSIAIALALLVTAVDGNTQEPALALRFAGYLLQEGDYYRAVTEYKRALFLAGPADTVLADAALLGVGQAYFAGAQYERAGEWLAQRAGTFRCAASSHDARELMVRAFLSVGRGDRVLTILLADPDTDEAVFHRGLAHANVGNWGEARSLFREVFQAPRLASASMSNSAVAEEALSAGWKSPSLAAVLGVVPGLGYFYAGHTQTGLSALIVNALFAISAYQAFDTGQDVFGGFLTLFSLSWYSSSIYGSVKAARRHNARLQRSLWAKVTY